MKKKPLSQVNDFGDDDSLIIPGAYWGYINTHPPKTAESKTSEPFEKGSSAFSRSETDRTGNKRTQTQDAFARSIITAGDLRVVGGNLLKRYIEKLGCFQRVLSPEKMIFEVLGPEVTATLTTHAIKEIAERLKWYQELQTDYDLFNCRPDLVNAENGVVNIALGTLLPHSPEYLFTYMVKAEYLGKNNHYCPAFDKFCKMSLDDDPQKRRLLLEILGYCCSDSNAAKAACFFKGEPDSGKSVFAEFISRLFDKELVSNVPLHRLSDRFNRAELYGKKVNIAGEIQGKKLTEITTFKAITGGDRISAEFKGKDVFSYSPRCKLLFAGNALPGTLESDATSAFANRLVVLLFNHTIPQNQQDKGLLNKLWEERDSIFSQAIEALADLQIRNYAFTLPEESKVVINSFREQGNPFRAFVQDCCVVNREARVHNTKLLGAFHAYCDKNGFEVCSKQQFYDLLSCIPGVTPARIRLGSDNRWGHKGIGLRGGTLEQGDGVTHV